MVFSRHYVQTSTANAEYIFGRAGSYYCHILGRKSKVQWHNPEIDFKPEHSLATAEQNYRSREVLRQLPRRPLLPVQRMLAGQRKAGWAAIAVRVGILTSDNFMVVEGPSVEQAWNQPED